MEIHAIEREAFLMPYSDFVVSEHSTRITVLRWEDFISLIKDYSPRQNGKPLVFYKNFQRKSKKKGNQKGTHFTSPLVGLEGGNCYVSLTGVDAEPITP